MNADRRVIACNYTEGTKIVPVGAKAYLLNVNRGNAADRVEILTRSRGNRWVRKWESSARLGSFRFKTIPPEHPRYADLEYAGYFDDQTLEMLECAR